MSADGELEPVPVANRVQAWTVGARWAFEHDWDGRRSQSGSSGIDDALVAAEQHGAGDRRRPEAVAHVVERGVERLGAPAVERQRELDRAVVVEVGERDADEREALALDQRHRRGEQVPRRGEDRLGLGRRLGQRVRARRAGEVVEAQPQHDGAADPAAPRAAGGRRGRPGRRRWRRAPPGDRRRRPSARCEPIERRRRPTRTRRGSRLWASACRCRPAARPSIATSAASGSSATSPTVVIPRAWSLRAVTGPDAPEPLDRQRVEERQLAVGRHDEQAVGLGHAARHLGEELGARHADGDRQPDLLEHLAPQPRGDLRRRARDPLAGRGRRGTPRRSTGPRPAAWCPRRPRTPPCSPRSRPSKRGGTTIACGHSRRACRPPIAVRTPHALAS